MVMSRQYLRRKTPWKAMDSLTAITDESSSSDPGSEDEEKSTVEGASFSRKWTIEGKGSETVGIGGKEVKLDFDGLSRHGYSGGPSILHIPAPKQERGDQNWLWSNGKRECGGRQEEESIKEREVTREIATERIMNVATAALAESTCANKQKRDAIAEQKALSFSRKEKRKRDLGQASRGKTYVEEEKRLLRDSGVYSGFDT